MKYWILLLFTALATSLFARPVSRDEAFTHLSRYEGVRYVPYRDGIYHSVGVGHQLRGVRKQRYSPSEIHTFFTQDFAVAREACRRGIAQFDSLPLAAQLTCIEIAFGCGPTGFRGFTRFRAAMSERRYHLAAQELDRSMWRTQVGMNRSRDAINRLRRLRD